MKALHYAPVCPTTLTFTECRRDVTLNPISLSEAADGMAKAFQEIFYPETLKNATPSTPSTSHISSDKPLPDTSSNQPLPNSKRAKKTNHADKKTETAIADKEQKGALTKDDIQFHATLRQHIKVEAKSTHDNLMNALDCAFLLFSHNAKLLLIDKETQKVIPSSVKKVEANKVEKRYDVRKTYKKSEKGIDVFSKSFWSDPIKASLDSGKTKLHESEASLNLSFLHGYKAKDFHVTDDGTHDTHKNFDNERTAINKSNVDALIAKVFVMGKYIAYKSLTCNPKNLLKSVRRDISRINSIESVKRVLKVIEETQVSGTPADRKVTWFKRGTTNQQRSIWMGLLVQTSHSVNERDSSKQHADVANRKDFWEFWGIDTSNGSASLNLEEKFILAYDAQKSLVETILKDSTVSEALKDQVKSDWDEFESANNDVYLKLIEAS